MVIYYSEKLAQIIFEYVREQSVTKLTILFENLNLDPNVQDENGNYPIHFIQTVEIGKILRMAGAKLFRANLLGQTPIHTGLAFSTNQGPTDFKLVLKFDLKTGRSRTIKQ